MNCKICGKKKATMFFMNISSQGIVEKGYYCFDCAKKNPEIKMMLEIFSEKKPSLKKKKVCSFCGLTLKDLKETGFTGCSQCYRVFRNYIRKEIRKIHPGFFHRGKSPYKDKKEVLISHLENIIRQAVAERDIEKIKKVKRALENIIKNG